MKKRFFRFQKQSQLGIKVEKTLKFRATVTAIAIVCLIASAGYLPSARSDIGHTNMTALNNAGFRWLDIADQAYGTSYQNSYGYAQATVKVDYTTAGNSLSGTLTASNLKPNFAYQIKLVGNPDTTGNEQIGLAGRWWQEEWNGAAWVKGQNLNTKGDGSYPNPNDQTYFTRRDVIDSSSPTGYHYRFTGYILFDYFITDSTGAATIQFETGNCYHVVWKTSQSSSTTNDGTTKTTTFGPTSQPVYDYIYSSKTVSIFGEWERLPSGQINLTPGVYNCQIVLTEESFHGSGGSLAGNWAGAMNGNLTFQITPTLPLPEYPLGALLGLTICSVAFIVFRITKRRYTAQDSYNS